MHIICVFPFSLERLYFMGDWLRNISREIYFPRNIHVFSWEYFPGKGIFFFYGYQFLIQGAYYFRLWGTGIPPDPIIGRGEWGPESVKQYVKMIFDVKYFHNCTLILTGNFSTLHTHKFSRWFKIDLFTTFMHIILTKVVPELTTWNLVRGLFDHGPTTNGLTSFP